MHDKQPLWRGASAAPAFWLLSGQLHSTHWHAAPAGLRPRLEPLLRLPSCSPDAQLPAGATSQRQAGYQAAFTESEDEADPADIPASPDGEPRDGGLLKPRHPDCASADPAWWPSKAGRYHVGWGGCCFWAVRPATDHKLKKAKLKKIVQAGALGRLPLRVLYEPV